MFSIYGTHKQAKADARAAYRRAWNPGKGGSASKKRGEHKVWLEAPIGTVGQRSRCACHYVYPCRRRAS